ncbi:universal stress protein [Nocardia puris]|uniref:universal stress protein n=1 Tax=Nocardia puris TaxID=208602 RepID=UPI0018957E8A|nr:universal stress protein [Nocardia puris]MBF6210185.1 universal stress protein [Nocardia puris]MBF6367262.1 universal stress protein [Nocardia puris]MBF6457446.1 universal stress protein [Nocardia puris]
MLRAPVVVGIDASEDALHATRWAAIDAALHDVPLRIVRAVGEPDEADAEELRAHRERYLENARDALAIAAEVATAAAEPITEIEVTADLVDDAPIPTLCAAATTARLVVVGSRGLGAYHRSLLGSVSTALARHAPGPVAIVTGPPPDRTAPVVVGVDASPQSARAVALAFDEAARRGVELVAVHAWTRYLRHAEVADSQREGARLLEESIAPALAENPEVRVRRVVAEDRPARRLLTESAHAQLVVVGSHGKGGFAGMTLGSTSQALLHSIDCPLIIARPEH